MEVSKTDVVNEMEISMADVAEEREALVIRRRCFPMLICSFNNTLRLVSQLKPPEWQDQTLIPAAADVITDRLSAPAYQ